MKLQIVFTHKTVFWFMTFKAENQHRQNKKTNQYSILTVLKKIKVSLETWRYQFRASELS